MIRLRQNWKGHRQNGRRGQNLEETKDKMWGREMGEGRLSEPRARAREGQRQDRKRGAESGEGI